MKMNKLKSKKRSKEEFYSNKWLLKKLKEEGEKLKNKQSN